MKKTILFLMFLVFISVIISQEDFDNDGMPDSWEKKYNLKYDVNDANEDADRDGLTNLQEYEQGSDPLVADIKVTFFSKVFGFFSGNIVKILVGIAVLIIIYFFVRVVVELFKLRKKKKKGKERKGKERKEDERRDEEEAKLIIRSMGALKIPSHQKRVAEEKKIKESFGKHKRRKLKEKKREFLTEIFEEKEGMEKELHPLPFSFSSKIKKVKEGFKEEKKTEERKEETASIFDRLPKRE